MAYVEAFIIFCLIILYKMLDAYSYWWRKGIDIVCFPLPIFGNIAQHIFMNKSYSRVLFDWYMKFKSKRFIGLYLSFRPYLLITDPTLSKEIMVDRFDQFSDRGYFDLESVDPLSLNLVTMDGFRWKLLRDSIQSAMSAGKLKTLMPAWEESCNQTVEIIKKNITNKVSSRVEILMQNLLIKLFVTSCLGMTYESFLQNPIMKEILDEIIYPTKLHSIRTIVVFMCPSLIKALNWSRYSKDQNNYVKNFFVKLAKVRENNLTSNHRDLFLNLAEIHSSDDVKNNFKDWESVFVANSLLLTVGGYDSAHIILSILLWELARHPEVQEKLYAEVKRTMDHHGHFNYEAISDMSYLDAVVQETLRIYPPFPFTMRRCQSQYSLTENGPVLDAGTSVIIPIESYHHDPEFFPEPLEFKPERFYKIGKDKYKNIYIPFGKGPRNCIGYHFARIQLRLITSILVYHIKFQLGPESPKKITFHHTSFARKLYQQLHLYPQLRTTNQQS